MFGPSMLNDFSDGCLQDAKCKSRSVVRAKSVLNDFSGGCLQAAKYKRRSVRAKSVADARSQSSTAYTAKERGIILKEVPALFDSCLLFA